MIVFVDNDNCIKAVDSTLDTTLTPLEIDDNDNPFADWSKSKICCFQVNIENGRVTMFTPYIPSEALDYIDSIGKELEDKALAADILLGNVEVEE